MQLSLASALRKVHVATTKKQKEAIYRMRYELYTKEIAKGNIGNADHTNKVVKDIEDELEGATLFYAGSEDKPSASFRTNAYNYDDAPPDVKSRYSLDIFPEFQGKTICELSRWVVEPRHQGSLLLLSMIVKVFEHGSKQGIDTSFLNCPPALSRVYRKFGYRMYSADLIHSPDGMRVPMIFVCSDLAYLDRMNSPLLSFARKYYGRGTGQVIFDIDQIVDRLDERTTNSAKVAPETWHNLDDAFFMAYHNENIIFEGMSQEEVNFLTEQGVILDVKQKCELVAEGNVEHDMYIIIKGTFEILSSNKENRIALLGKGEIFGELAFFSEQSIRRASVVACEDSQVLMLKVNYVHRLMSEHKGLAAKLLYNISRILAQRCSDLLSI